MWVVSSGVPDGSASVLCIDPRFLDWLKSLFFASGNEFVFHWIRLTDLATVLPFVFGSFLHIAAKIETPFMRYVSLWVVTTMHSTREISKATTALVVSMEEAEPIIKQYFKNASDTEVRFFLCCWNWWNQPIEAWRRRPDLITKWISLHGTALWKETLFHCYMLKIQNPDPAQALPLFSKPISLLRSSDWLQKLKKTQRVNTLISNQS